MNTIYEIRKKLGYSQEKLAEILGVSFSSVNRWENGRIIPNILVQEKLLALSLDKNIDVLDIVKNNINNEVLPIDNSIILFHGSKQGLKGDIKPISKDRCDFGKGFYMGDNPLQSLTLISDFKDSEFYVLSLNKNKLKIKDIPLDLDWAFLIAYNRGYLDEIKGTDFYNKYKYMLKDVDIAIGYIANDRMFTVLDDFFKGTMSDVALLKCLSALKIGKQYVALSNSATNSIKIEKKIDLLWLEKEVIKIEGKKNRLVGISLADEIRKKYRRQGRFFDEIINK